MLLRNSYISHTRQTFAYSFTVPNAAAVQTHPSQYPKEVELNLYRVPRRAVLHLRRANCDAGVNITRGRSQVVRTVGQSQIPLNFQYIYIYTHPARVVWTRYDPE